MWLAGSVSAMQLAVTAVLLRLGPTDVNFAMCRTALKLRLPVDGAAIRHPMATLLISLGAPRCGFRFYRAGFGWRSVCGSNPVAGLPWCFPAGQILVEARIGAHRRPLARSHGRARDESWARRRGASDGAQVRRIAPR